MFLLDSLLIDGLKFVMEKLLQIAEAELNDELEAVELSVDEFTGIEQDVFARLREVRGGHTAPISMTSKDASVTVEAAEELDK